MSSSGFHQFFKWMVFVDGQSLTRHWLEKFCPGEPRLRQLEDVSKFFTLREGNYSEGAFYWPAETLSNNPQDWVGEGFFRGPALRLTGLPIRSYYYTAVSGDTDRRQRLEAVIRKNNFEPRVFRTSRRSKGIDIALSTDLLSHAFRNNYEACVLIASDGDYAPLLEEAKRLGKRTIVSYFDSEIDERLLLAADATASLDEAFLR